MRRNPAIGQLRHSNAQLQALVRGRTQQLQQSNAALGDAKERLQVLSGQLISAQEQERRRFARELHDETAQALTLIRMQLAELAGGRGDLQAQVADCVQHVDRAVRHIRGLALSLRPPMLDDLGLAEALEWVAEQQASHAGWHLRLEVAELRERLPEPVETACFRICQEALTNAARHAQATQVQVALRCSEHGVELLVVDNGRGFELERFRTPEERKRHFGLVSMAERAALAGGHLDIATAPGNGTRVRVGF